MVVVATADLAFANEEEASELNRQFDLLWKILCWIILGVTSFRRMSWYAAISFS